MAHAVARLRAARLALSSKPFLARGGPKGLRCAGCRLLPSHCLCAWRPRVATRAGICLLMADTEPLKPSNTGWLVADVVPDTFAFGWTRTATDHGLLALLQDPQWQALLVFPQDYATPARVLHALPPALQRSAAHPEAQAQAPGMGTGPGPRPLFILLDGTWAEARKMFRKSPVLDALPVLDLQAGDAGETAPYLLRRSRCAEHFCTSAVAARCLALAGDSAAAAVLDAYLAVFSHHYLQARHQLPADLQGPAHQRLRALCQPAGSADAG